MYKMTIWITALFLVLIYPGSFAIPQERFPNKPIQIVCPYPPGGNADMSARIVGDKIGEYVGQPVIVVNKAGGATALGTSFVATSKPDGYTLLTVSAGIVLIVLTTPDLPYKLSDFTPVGTTISYNYLVAVQKDFPAKNLSEMVDYVKKNPNKLNYASGAIGGNTYFLAQLLKLNAKLNWQHIPYPGTAPIVMALSGNHIQIAFLPVSDCLSQVRSGAFRALAIFSDKRDPFLPEVPTCVEQGFPELATSSFQIIFAPAKTPEPVIKRLEEGLEKALMDEKVQGNIKKINAAPEFHNSRFVQGFLDSEYRKWSAVIKKLNVDQR